MSKILEGLLVEPGLEKYQAMKISKDSDTDAARALFYEYNPKNPDFENKATFTLVDDSIKRGTGGYDAVLNKITKDYADKPMYVIVDFEFNTDDGRPQRKLVFVLWIPETCPVKLKMPATSAAQAFKAKIEAGLPTVQANDAADLAFDEVKSKLTKK